MCSLTFWMFTFTELVCGVTAKNFWMNRHLCTLWRHWWPVLCNSRPWKRGGDPWGGACVLAGVSTCRRSATPAARGEPTVSQLDRLSRWLLFIVSEFRFVGEHSSTRDATMKRSHEDDGSENILLRTEKISPHSRASIFSAHQMKIYRYA